MCLNRQLFANADENFAKANSEKAASNQNGGSDFIFLHVVCIETDNQMNSAAGFCLNRQLFADSFISQYQLSLLSLQVDKSCGSPVTSSCENSFRITCPSSLPLVSKGSVLFLRCLFVIFCCDRKSYTHSLFSCDTTPTLYVVTHVSCGLQDFSRDFSDLDGVVQQRRQEMMESSSSGSQTPDYDKLAGVSPIFFPPV